MFEVYRFKKVICQQMSRLLMYRYNEFTNKIFDAYPGLKERAKEAVAKNESPFQFSVWWLREILVREIETLSSEKKEAMQSHLLDRNPDAKAPFALADMAKAFISVTFIAFEDGELDEFEQRMVISEITGAIQGFNREERSERRIAEAAIEAILPSEDR